MMTCFFWINQDCFFPSIFETSSHQRFKNYRSSIIYRKLYYLSKTIDQPLFWRYLINIDQYWQSKSLQCFVMFSLCSLALSLVRPCPSKSWSLMVSVHSVAVGQPGDKRGSPCHSWYRGIWETWEIIVLFLVLFLVIPYVSIRIV